MIHREKVSVFGAGAFGTALAQTFARNGSSVRMWARSQKTVDEINHHKRNLRYAGESVLDPKISATTDLTQCLKSSDIWVYACPSTYFKEFLHEIHSIQRSTKLDFQPLINTCKGLEPSSLQLYHYVAEEILGEEFALTKYYCLSGPSFASEILRDVPTCLTLCGRNTAGLLHLQRQLSNSHFRLYTNTDLIGTQLGGAMKNVLAIAAGIIDGLGLGYNTQAAFINLGLGEMARLGQAMGAHIETFLGFSGVGDLILTCTSPLSRNRSFGQLLGQGKSIQEAFEICGSTIEGYPAAKIIYELTQQKIVRAPICEEVFHILHNGKPLKESFHDLLSHPPRAEWI